jgi:hypothetical protein
MAVDGRSCKKSRKRQPQPGAATASSTTRKLKIDVWLSEQYYKAFYKK